MERSEHHIAEAADSVRRFLLGLIHEGSEKFLLRNSLLEKIQHGEMTKEEWREFAVQRYLAAVPFEDLLRAGIRGAEQSGLSELESSLEKNLSDETGIDEHGVYREELVHHTWRRDFYTRIGIDEHDLASASPTAGTKMYYDIAERIGREQDPLVIAGALLVLEGTIPAEFRKMKEGRDKTFHEIFVDQDSDSAETKTKKAKARLYLDDHIHHDATEHLPDLLRALEASVKTEGDRERIAKGAREIAEAKRAFYERQRDS